MVAMTRVEVTQSTMAMLQVKMFCVFLSLLLAMMTENCYKYNKTNEAYSSH